MVNTFLVHPDYVESAKCLDSRRLNKQKLEAKQILTVLEYLKILSEIYNIPKPNNPYEYYEWIRIVAKKYKNEPYHLLYRNGQWHQIDKLIKMEKIKSDEIIIGIGPQFKLKNINTLKYRYVDKDKLLMSNEIWITLGYVYHPIMLMWLGHEESLKKYINAHIDEWIRRGGKNTMKLYDFSDKNTQPKQPKWTYDIAIHRCHKSNLLRKEIENNETKHYQLLNNFQENIPNLEYFWPYTPKVGSGISDDLKRYRNGSIHLNYHI